MSTIWKALKPAGLHYYVSIDLIWIVELVILLIKPCHSLYTLALSKMDANKQLPSLHFLSGTVSVIQLQWNHFKLNTI